MVGQDARGEERGSDVGPARRGSEQVHAVAGLVDSRTGPTTQRSQSARMQLRPKDPIPGRIGCCGTDDVDLFGTPVVACVGGDSADELGHFDDHGAQACG